MNIVQNTALRPLLRLTDDDGWETSVGQAFKTVFYTSNYFAALSSDGGHTYTKVSPFDLAKSVGESFCCDQVAHYVPAANLMVWILLGDPVIMGLASPDDLVSSKGKAWTIYVLDGAVFRRERGTQFDYPQASFGDNFLYLTFNIIGTNDAILCRFHVSELRRRDTLHFQYFVAVNSPYVCPSEMSGDRGLFVVQNTTSKLRVFEWRENSNNISWHDINISTIPTEDWIIKTPDSNEWLTPGSKIDTAVTGVARGRRNELWAAWSGARKVAGRREQSFLHPHIGVAVISIQSMTLARQLYLWNPEHAFAYPSLASNPAGEIALTFAWGGDKHYVQHGVGFLTDPIELWSTTSSEGITGGGHYITARMEFPEIDQFIGAGYNSPKVPSKPGAYLNHPRYVRFRR